MTLPQQTSNGALRSGKPQSKNSRDPHLNEGVMLVEVDDILEGGTEAHRRRREISYERWKCGKKQNLRECGDDGGMISGVHVVQHNIILSHGMFSATLTKSYR